MEGRPPPIPLCQERSLGKSSLGQAGIRGCEAGLREPFPREEVGGNMSGELKLQVP